MNRTHPVAGLAVGGELVDGQGNSVMSVGTSAATGGFGPALRRYAMSGIYNSDFAIGPASGQGAITDGNPLPFWTWTIVSGTAITATRVADTSAASGFAIRLSMSDGAAADEAYLEQIVPVNGTRSQVWGYVAYITAMNATLANNAQVYLTAQYLKNDGTTTTGTAATGSQLWSALLGVTLDTRVFPGGSSGAPADAYYLRIRIGCKRDTAATTDTGTVDIADAHVETAPSGAWLADQSLPTYNLAQLYQASGLFTVSVLGDGTNGVIRLIPAHRSELWKRVVFPPASPQALVAATTIAPTDVVLPITATAPVTITAAPTVSDGVNGQIVVLVNTSANAITIQDQGTLASSNLRLSTATYVIGTRDNITLLYSSTVGDWIEIARTNVI